jgi:sugar lactone lactonase YvrE
MEEAEHLLRVQNRLGEGPRWHPGERALYWVDIEQHFVYKYNPQSGKHERFDAGQPVGALAFRRSGGLLLALRDGFAFRGKRQQELEFIASPEEGREDEGARFNDGNVDRNGRFWAGTTSAGAGPTSALYRLDPDLSVHTMIEGVHISNGIGWSPDDRTMYYADTATDTICAYDYDPATGSISNRRVLVDTSDEEGYPDGLAIDAQGCIWHAFWGGWKVVRYSPAGEKLMEVRLPVAQVTACAFGGPDLTDLYITTAWTGMTEEQRAAQPLAGDLFVFHTDVKGQEEQFFAG